MSFVYSATASPSNGHLSVFHHEAGFIASYVILIISTSDHWHDYFADISLIATRVTLRAYPDASPLAWFHDVRTVLYTSMPVSLASSEKNAQASEKHFRRAARREIPAHSTSASKIVPHSRLYHVPKKQATHCIESPSTVPTTLFINKVMKQNAGHFQFARF
jgi:hypothetical protein